MGISIDVNLYEKDKLLQKLEAWGAKDKELTMKILEACGTFLGDTYVLLNNELYDGYSPYYNVAELFDSAFDGEDSFDIFLHEYREGINAVDLDDVADELGITLKDDEDED
jgi:hypothetical protein